MAGASRLRSGTGSTSQEGGVPPPNADALFEILLRVPAKDLDRCRAVRRPWHCILTDPHAARHDPLVIIGYCPYSQNGYYYPSSQNPLCDIMDLSGRVLKHKQVRGTGKWRYMPLVGIK